MDDSDKDSLGYTEVDFQKVAEFAQTDPNGPSKRTVKVYQYLAAADRFTNWDLICFSTEYLASQVATLPWLVSPAKWLVRLVYMAHYYRFEKHLWLDQEPISASGRSPEKENDGESTTGESQSSSSTS